MISWRVCVVFMVACYLEAVLSCTFNSECDDYDETCCEDGYCSSSCSDDSSGGVSAVLVVIIVIAVVFKVLCWGAICCCRTRKPRTVVVSHSTFEMMPPNYPNPPQEGYPPPQAYSLPNNVLVVDVHDPGPPPPYTAGPGS